MTLLTLIATLWLQGESPIYILNEDRQPVIRAIRVSHTACKDEFRRNLRYHTQLAKMSSDKIFDLTAGVYYNFYNISRGLILPMKRVSKTIH